MLPKSLLAELKVVLKDPSIAPIEIVQSLWSGYGSIVRCYSAANNNHIIVKHVCPDVSSKNHPRGWNTSVSHQRKLKSYQVEQAFYQIYSPLTDQHCRAPQLLCSQETEHGRILCMEDLDGAGFFVRKGTADWLTVKLGIKWLAYFHARFMNESVAELWDTGCYWHFATRQDEWQAMPEGALKDSAAKLDAKLQQAQFQTLVHGDAKLANMCFHYSGNAVACVDFQYVGRGIGVRDLAYFVGSCFEQRQLERYHDDILTEYFEQLQMALNTYSKQLDMAALKAEYSRLYPVAWADFHRFLQGWNPQSWKVNPYMADMTDKALLLLE